MLKTKRVAPTKAIHTPLKAKRKAFKARSEAHKSTEISWIKLFKYLSSIKL